MNGWKAFFAGVLLIVAVLFIAGFVAVGRGLIPANADERPPRVERWASRVSLRAVLARLPAQTNPVPATDENLIAGIKLYGQNCAVCHGDKSGRPTNIARGLYISAPQLAKKGVEDDPDQVNFWKIAHGLRWTGMPAFGKTLSQDQIWQLTAFLKTMDHLPPAADRVWRQVSTGGASGRALPKAQPQKHTS